ncbi:30S ribosomal protein S6 [Rickettsia hoogstraalii]|uniref:30S ribosomal protein S6 n=1 Tax=Rickettsia hoogstraalii TaxID=467174 RepID=UPI00225466B8|nr:30S ribosomal protein S6 [Rickettsia hoogstraalii]MCX4084411.1 30S ribosomal protein S6 [Rickettsia hoogstraalii]
MSFYESVFIIRQDVSLNDIDKIVDDFAKIIKDNNGTIIKKEYWGLRTLAYKIGNNKKGHYYFLGLDITGNVKEELERKMKLNGNIIRFLTIKADSISSEPSPILKNQSTENTPVIDVTINN